MAKLLERTIALEAGTSGEGNKFPKNDCGGVGVCGGGYGNTCIIIII